MIPGLEVEGVGMVSLPLSDRTVKALIKARMRKGNRAVVWL
jgi:hypothetical protein